MIIGAGDMLASVKCVSCDQAFGSNDRYLSPQLVPLKWGRLKRNPATGQNDLPEGSECHACEKTRTDTFNRMSASTLREQRAANEETEAMWEQRRRENAIPGKRVPIIQFNVSAATTKKSFLETFDEGTWFPIRVYIRKVNGPEHQLDTPEKQIAWVTSVARQKVKFMSGQPGVVVLDHDDGRKRIKIGRSAETETREEHDCAGDAAACEELFAEADRKNLAVIENQTTLDAVRQLLGPRGANGSTIPAEPSANMRSGPGPSRLNFDLFDESQSSLPWAATASSPSLPAQRAEDDIVMPQSQLERSSSKRRQASEEHPLVPPTPPVSQKRPRASQAKNPESKIISTSRKDPASETPDGNGQAPNQTSSGQAMSKRHRALYDKAQAALTKYVETFSNKSIWENKPRKRQVESAVKSMEVHSGKLVAIGHADSDRLVQDIHEWIDDVMPRFDVITEVRTNPRDFVDSVSDDHIKLLKGMGVNLVSQMIIAIAADCLKSLDSAEDATARDCVSKFCKVCSCSRPSKDSSVNGLVQDFRITIPKFDLVCMDTNMKPNELDIDSPSGFSTLVLTEVAVLRTLCIEKWAEASDSELVSAKVTVEIKDNLCPKMQTLTKANGMTKSLWMALADASKRAATPSSIGSEALASLADVPQDEILRAADAQDLASLLAQGIWQRADRAVQAFMALKTFKDQVTIDVPQEKVLELENCVSNVESLVKSHGLAVLAKVCNDIGTTKFWKTWDQSLEYTQSLSLNVVHLQSWLICYQVVPPEHRSLLYNIIDSYKQMLVCQPFIHSAEKGLTIGSFSDAVRQINKLTQSKGVKGLYHDVDILKGAEGMERLSTCNAALRTALDSDDFKKELQISWLKLLLKSGSHAEIIEIDSSVKSILDQPAGTFARSLEVMKQLSSLSDVSAGIEMPSKAGAKEMMNHIVQLLYTNSEDAEHAGFAKFNAMKQDMRAYLAENIKTMCQEIKKQKHVIEDTYGKFSGLVPAVGSWDEDKMKAILTKQSSDRGEEVIAGMVNCAKSLYALQEAVAILMQWEKEFDEKLLDLKPDFVALVEAYSAPPKSEDIAMVVACTVGSDMAFTFAEMKPSDVVPKVGNFFTFCADQLRLLKKNLPKPLVDKMDKTAKDARAMPPPAAPSTPRKGRVSNQGLNGDNTPSKSPSKRRDD